MSSKPSSTARQKFAKRLRALRVVRGFKSARSLAHALGIDENRYTRYERAEVEPDIELIQQICETLRLSPNDLLGLHTSPRDRLAISVQPPPLPGLAEPEQAQIVTLEARDRGDLQDRAAWLLACAVAELQKGDGAMEPSPLATLQRAARLFTDIESRPYAAVSEILLLPAIAGAAPDDALRISKLIKAVARPIA